MNSTQPQQPPQASTAGQFTASGGAPQQWTAADVARATPAELSKAINAGQLRAYFEAPNNYVQSAH